MRIDILTLMPGMFDSVFDHGIVRRARSAGRLAVFAHPLTNWSGGRFQRADDAPYGGGAGMVLRVKPLVAAVESIRDLDPCPGRILLLSPRGRPLTQGLTAELAREPRLLLVAGRYEGVDERFIEIVGAEEVSVGDFVLSGGEIPAMALVDAVTRLLPGAVGDPDSVADESFSAGLLEHPHYTRPATFRGLEVPAVLRSGDHEAVRRYRRERSLALTESRRPDLHRVALAAGRAGPAPGGDPRAGTIEENER